MVSEPVEGHRLQNQRIFVLKVFHLVSEFQLIFILIVWAISYDVISLKTWGFQEMSVLRLAVISSRPENEHRHQRLSAEDAHMELRKVGNTLLCE